MHEQDRFFDALDQFDGRGPHVQATSFDARAAGEVLGQPLEPACAALSSAHQPQGGFWFELVEVVDQHVETQAQAGQRIAQLMRDRCQELFLATGRLAPSGIDRTDQRCEGNVGDVCRGPNRRSCCEAHRHVIALSPNCCRSVSSTSAAANFADFYTWSQDDLS